MNIYSYVSMYTYTSHIYMNQLNLNFRYFLSLFNFYYENFKHTQKKTELYNEALGTYYPDSTITHIFSCCLFYFPSLKKITYFLMMP